MYQGIGKSLLLIGIHAGPTLNVGDAPNRRLDLVRVIPLELQQLGPLGRVRHLGQEVIEDLGGGLKLADVCLFMEYEMSMELEKGT